MNRHHHSHKYCLWGRDHCHTQCRTHSDHLTIGWGTGKCSNHHHCDLHIDHHVGRAHCCTRCTNRTELLSRCQLEYTHTPILPPGGLKYNFPTYMGHSRRPSIPHTCRRSNLGSIYTDVIQGHIHHLHRSASPGSHQEGQWVPRIL